MTRKDYIAIANVIVKTKAYRNVDFIVELMDMFAEDNSRFNPEQFENYIENIYSVYHEEGKQ